MLPVSACSVSSACIVRSPWYQCESAKPGADGDGMVLRPELGELHDLARPRSVIDATFSGVYCAISSFRSLSADEAPSTSPKRSGSFAFSIGLTVPSAASTTRYDFPWRRNFFVAASTRNGATVYALQVGAVVELPLQHVVDDAVDQGGVGARPDRQPHVGARRGRREARVDRHDRRALPLRVGDDPPVGDRGLGDVVRPEDDHLGVEEVGHLVAVEDAAGGRHGVGEHVVPARRRGAVAFVVALEVAGRGADRAREAEPRRRRRLRGSRASRCTARSRPTSSRTSPGRP